MSGARRPAAPAGWGAGRDDRRDSRKPFSRGIPPEDAEIVDFTRQLLRRHRIDEASFKKMQERFGNDGLIQLTGAIGYYSMLAMTVNACELEAAPGADVLKV